MPKIQMPRIIILPNDRTINFVKMVLSILKEILSSISSNKFSINRDNQLRKSTTPKIKFFSLIFEGYKNIFFQFFLILLNIL
ncbi:hypothetical protein CUS68_13650 [Enterococcus faecium]|nr:hypothetical protein CUS68_13650 [Enterococcus faecium]